MRDSFFVSQDQSQFDLVGEMDVDTTIVDNSSCLPSHVLTLARIVLQTADARSVQIDDVEGGRLIIRKDHQV